MWVTRTVGYKRAVTDYAAAGKAFRDRRVGMGLTQAQACRDSAVSRSTWHRIETGTGPVSAANAAAICRTLGWAPETYDRLLVGDEPVDVAARSATVAGDDRTMLQRLDALETLIVRIADSVGIDPFSDAE